MKFEDFILGAPFYSSLLSFGIAAFLFIAAIYIALVFLSPHMAKQMFPFLKLYMNIAKFLTCCIAVFLVFCINYEAQQIQFFVPLDNMSVSTFLVGALALWELIAMATDMLSIVDNSLPDTKI